MRALNFAFAMLLIVVSCGSDTAEPGNKPQPGTPSLTIRAGAGVSDTVLSARTQGLVIEVKGDSGKTAVGSEVRFEVPTDGNMSVSGVSSGTYGAVAGAITDAQGRAAVLVRMGTKAGAGYIVVKVPLYNLSDTARYTVQPGAPARVTIAPHDTAVIQGTSFTYRAAIADAYGNARTDPVTFEVSGTAVTVNSSGLASAVGMGPARVRLRGQVAGSSASDSANVLVVPAATLAWSGYSSGDGMSIGDLTGKSTAQYNDAGIAPSWEPNGSRIVSQKDSRFLIVNTSLGSITPLATPGFTDVLWPEWANDGWIYFYGIPTNSYYMRLGRVRPDGSTAEALPTPNGSTYAAPSPDGKFVAYCTNQLAILDLGTGVSRVLPGTSPCNNTRWSPDGSWIAYVTTNYAGTLMLARPDGSKVVAVANNLGPSISWSTDSKWLLSSGLYGPYWVDVATLTTMKLNLPSGWYVGLRR